VDDGSVTDDGTLPLEDDVEAEDDDDWERRFSIASVVCCSTVVLVVVPGVVLGCFLDTGDRQPVSGLAGIMLQQGRSYVFLRRASLVLAPFTMFAAILILLAVLLGVMGRTDADGESAPLLIAESVGWAVTGGALLLLGVSVWWAGVNPVPIHHLPRGVRVANVAGPLATAIIAAATTWWARNERRSA
jgi:hypothetical protein